MQFKFIFFICLMIISSCNNKRFTTSININKSVRYIEFVDSVIQQHSKYNTIKWIFVHPVNVQRTEDVVNDNFGDKELLIPQTFVPPPTILTYELSDFSFEESKINVDVLHPPNLDINLDSLCYAESIKRGKGIIFSKPYFWRDYQDKKWIDYQIIENPSYDLGYFRIEYK
ncbi:hypothetical protein [Flammeovirga aprica]|uniref:Lipoprotein n=1 Tax=Flammeovirga aprica JL-4 TaxID=694437 RepID=A0A7X9RZ22_9BACT|nr:hypothetical protein [Flammeovirga aprica]NME71257.1 hypothetical protein [Flammeovirga aprica JL-4]